MHRFIASVCFLTLGASAVVVIWTDVLRYQPGTLTVSFMDIGQGDAILVRGPTGVTLLIDGGPDQSVVRRLPDEIGVLATSIDVIVETHPDKDHIGGLAGVLDKYDVRYFITPGIPNDTAATHELRQAVQDEPGLRSVIARRGMRLHLGKSAHADVLFPDRDQSTQTETNAGSIALKLVYGDTSFLLTGDLPSAIEEYLVSLDNVQLQSDVLKAGHHGSKNSSSELWLATVAPAVVAISAGKGNSYKHPNPETIERIQKAGAQIVSTIESGTLRFVSDGRRITLETPMKEAPQSLPSAP